MFENPMLSSVVLVGALLCVVERHSLRWPPILATESQTFLWIDFLLPEWALRASRALSMRTSSTGLSA